jgi:hypothetical protein
MGSLILLISLISLKRRVQTASYHVFQGIKWAMLLDRGGIGSIMGGVNEGSPVGRESMARRYPDEVRSLAEQ